MVGVEGVLFDFHLTLRGSYASSLHSLPIQWCGQKKMEASEVSSPTSQILGNFH